MSNSENVPEWYEQKSKDIQERLRQITEDLHDLQVELATRRHAMEQIPALDSKLSDCNVRLSELKGQISVQSDLDTRMYAFANENATLRGELNGIKDAIDKRFDSSDRHLDTVWKVIIGAGLVGTVLGGVQSWRMQDKFDMVTTLAEKINKVGENVTREETKVGDFTGKLAANQQSLLETSRGIKQLEYDVAHNLLIDRVEKTLSDLELIDQLRFDRFSRERETIAICLEQLGQLDARTPGVIKHHGDIHFVEAAHLFASNRSHAINEAESNRILRLLDQVPAPEQTCNYWYFSASMKFRSGQLDAAKEAMDKALGASGGTTPLVKTRIMYGKLLEHLFKRIDDKTLELKDQQALLQEEFETFLGESPTYWPARLAYSTFLAHLKRREDALEQLAMAIDGGGASIDNIVEVIEHDLKIPRERENQLIPKLFPAGSKWQDSLRAELAKRRDSRRSKAQSKS